jgi:hypothetical protein
MIPIASVLSGGLTWSKLSCTRHQLKLNHEIVGALYKPSFWSSAFEAETQNGRWTFLRTGFWRTGAAIVDAVSKQTIATSKSGWAGCGTLTFADGQIFQVERKGWWHPAWSVLTESGQPVMRIDTREKSVNLPASTAVISKDRLALLLMFAWYYILQAEQDAAAAVMVAGVS